MKNVIFFLATCYRNLGLFFVAQYSSPVSYSKTEKTNQIVSAIGSNIRGFLIV